MASEECSYSLSEIVARLGGEVLGDDKTVIRGVASLQSAGADSVTFLTDARYATQLSESRAGAVIVGEGARHATDRPRIVCADPHVYFARVCVLFNPVPSPRAGQHPTAVIDATAVISPRAEIGPLAVIGRNVRIGEGSVIGAGCFVGDDSRIGTETRLKPNVTVYHGCTIGDRVILHSGAVVGSDGFGLAMENGRWMKVPQIGGVIIGDDVEIGANTAIDRGALDNTVIEEGVKLDNQIHVAHNVRIGAHTAIAACVGIAGSTTIGRNCRIGGAAGIAGHLAITDNVEISAYTAVIKPIPRPGQYSGVFGFEPHAKWLRNAALMRNLSDLFKRVRELEKELKQKKRSKS